VGHAGLTTFLKQAKAEEPLAVAGERVGGSGRQQWSIDRDDIDVPQLAQRGVAFVHAHTLSPNQLPVAHDYEAVAAAAFREADVDAHEVHATRASEPEQITRDDFAG
jgi:hypothetical protein